MPPSCDPFLRFEKQLVEEQAKATASGWMSDVPSVVGCRIWEVVFDDSKVPLFLTCSVVVLLPEVCLEHILNIMLLYFYCTCNLY